MQNENGANLAAVSEDGRYVAFQTDADLVPEDVSQFRDLDVYLLDRATGAVTLVSKDSTGAGVGAFDPSISGDGNFIAYVSDNANIVPGDTNGPGGAQRGWDVFVGTACTTRPSGSAWTVRGNGSSPASGLT